MRTIYITDGQIDMIERSLNEGAFNNVVENKVPSAQDQVKGKVNAGIMDGVTGCGMMEEEMLCENQNDKLANDYVKNNIGIEDFQEIRDYIFQICHAIPNVRFNKRYYLLGVIRLIYEEKLRGRHLSELNNILYNIRERNDILDRNLDGLSFMDLWEEYYNTEDSVNNVDSVEKIRKTPTGYIIKHIESYEESYNSGPQDWCITYEEEYYYSVVSEGDCIYIVENPEMMKSIDTKSKEFDYACRMMGDPTLYDLGEYGSGEPPYDTYGLSRFVVLVNPNGTYVYSRWNVPDDLDGQFLNREELEEVIGMPFNEAFPYIKPDEVDDEIKQDYCLRESVENNDNEFKIEGVTEETTFNNAFKPIANFMKNEGLNVYPFPDIELNWDEQDGLFIKTGYYLPSEKKVVLFCKDRHPKDILRSYAHEMIHHMQNLNGDDLNFTSEDDVKDNDKLEKLESEAYLKGNIYFRKWTEHVSKNSDDTLNESVLKESPDSIENPKLGYDNDSAYPFIAIKGFPNDILVGINGSTHWDIVERIEGDAEEGENTYRVSQELLDAVKSREVKPAITSYYEFYGRYWSDDGEGGHIISLWGYDKNDYHKAYSDIVRAVGKMQDEGIEIDFSTLDFDDWRRNFSSFRYPVTWLGNGMAEIYVPRARQIKKENGYYIIFLDNGRALKVDIKGNVVGNAMPSFSINESPDRVEGTDNLKYYNRGAFPFIVFDGYPNDVIVGEEGDTHNSIVERLGDFVDDDNNQTLMSNELYQEIKFGDIEITENYSYSLWGRYWDCDQQRGNIISFYDYTLSELKQKYSQIITILKHLESKGINIDINTIDIDHWACEGLQYSRFPLKWVANGMAESLLEISYRISRSFFYDKAIYAVVAKNGNIIKMDYDGNVINEPKTALAENTIYTPKVDESLAPSEVDLSSFNIKKELNPKFWKDDKLDSRIRIKLLDIADDFIEFLGVDWVKPEDITITGSLANYNWNKKYSDIDLHILINYSKVDKRIDFVDNYFYSQKKLWNEEHKDLRIFGFPVEVYVQDINKEHTSSGVYSLEKNEWVIEPEREKLSKKKVNKERIKKTVSQYTEKIDKLVDNSKNTNGDDYKMRKVYEDAQQLFDEIKKLRREDLSDANNEINEGNIIFKALRRLGYIDKLDKVINKGYNTLNSLP